MFAESLFAKMAWLSDNKDKAVDEAHNAKSIEAKKVFFASIVAHTNESVENTDVNNLSVERLFNIAVGINLAKNLPADKLEKKIYKETIDEYTGLLTSAISGALELTDEEKRARIFSTR